MLTTIKHKKQSVLSGFTIIELLVVMVVIGILAGITAVSFNGIKQKAVESSIKSDLNGAGKELEMIKTVHGSYPNDLNCNASDGINTYCPPGGVVGYEYHTSTDRQSYSLSKNIENNRLAITNNGLPINCPAGFIIVPGSATYGTSDFCVMKYEAKNVGGIPASIPENKPWDTISATDAKTKSKLVSGCTGCHLITEDEWMTIAQNILNVPNNWYDISGIKYIYRGHSDNNPAASLPANSSDSAGYEGTGNGSSNGQEQRRTFTLSNGEVIWDLAGNVTEFTDKTITGSQPGVAPSGFREWNSIITNIGTMEYKSTPGSTGYPSITDMTSSRGIGQIYTVPSATNTRYYSRGGRANDHAGAGVLSLILFNNGASASLYGFRVATR